MAQIHNLDDLRDRLGGALASPAMAASGSTEYPANSAARSFTGGTSGWTSSSSFDGTCIPPVLCPSVTNSYVGSGDAESNGYLTSSYLGVVGVGGVGGTTTAVWQSPAFTYSGGAATFRMSRRSDVGQLLAVAGNSATYAVQFVDLSEGGNQVAVIAPTSLAGADDWTPVSANISAARLNKGDSYAIRIVTSYSTGTSVLVTGSADYDNVALRGGEGGGDGDGNGNGGGKNGNDGGNGGNGRNTLRSSELLSLFSSGQPGSAGVLANGKRLAVRVNCPKKIGRACRVTAQGLLRKHKPVTAKRTVKVSKGGHRTIVLKVKPKFRATVAKRKRLLVKQKVKAGKAKATSYKVRKLLHR